MAAGALKSSASLLAGLVIVGLADLAWLNLSLAPRLARELAEKRSDDQRRADEIRAGVGDDLLPQGPGQRARQATARAPATAPPPEPAPAAQAPAAQAPSALAPSAPDRDDTPRAPVGAAESLGVAAPAGGEAPRERGSAAPPELPNLTFATASAALDAGARQVLRRAARALAARPEARLHLRGFADPRGTDELNLRLSAARAEGARDYLLSRGAAAERVTAEGLGATEQAETPSASAWAQSRRVELVWR